MINLRLLFKKKNTFSLIRELQMSDWLPLPSPLVDADGWLDCGFSSGSQVLPLPSQSSSESKLVLRVETMARRTTDSSKDNAWNYYQEKKKKTDPINLW